MSRCRSAVVIAVLTGLVFSCGGEQSESDTVARCVEPSSGQDAVGTKQIDDIRRAAVRTVVEEISLGTAVAEPEEQFGLVSDVDRDSEDNLYVADAHAKKVFVFSRTGSRLRSIGQEGEGPGEFNGLISIVLTDGDRLRVFDLNLWRETVFDLSGSVLRTHNLPQPHEFGQIPEVDYDRHGQLYNMGYQRFASTLKKALSEGAEVARGDVTIDRWSRADESWATLVTVPSIAVYLTGGGIRDAPFANRPLWDPVPSGGVWYADSGEYRLVRLSTTGDTLCRIRANVPRPDVSEREREAYLRGADLEGVSEDRLRRIRERRQEMPIPDHRPVLSELVSARTGGVWVRPAPRRWGAEPDSVRWHAYSSNGRLEARVQLPTNVNPIRVGPEEVIGVRRGPSDVDQVVVLETTAR